MLLESGARELLHSIVGSVSSVLHRTRDILDVVFNLVIVGGIWDRVRADEVDQRLNALHEQSGLVFEVVLQPVRMLA